MKDLQSYLEVLSAYSDDGAAGCACPAVRLVPSPRRARSASLAAAVAATLLAGAAGGAPGDLDPSYGDVGRAAIPASASLHAWSVESLANESVLFGGGDDYCWYDGYYCTFGGNLGLLTAGGAVDGSFAATFLADLRITDLAVQPDQKIVGVGTRMVSGVRQMAVFRMSPSGALDNSFAGGLQVLAAPTGSFQRASSVVIDDQQRIVIAGIRDDHLLVMRLLADGTLDLDFGTAGVFVGPVAFGTDAIPRIVPVTGGFRVMANGSGCQVIAVTSAGVTDAGYGAGGIAQPPGATYCNSVAAQSGDRLVLGGAADDVPTAWRLLSDGAPDATFDGASIAVTHASVTAMAVAPGDKIMVGGRPSATGSAGLVTRLTANGALDATFGAAGLSYFDLLSNQGAWPVVHEMKVLANGRILLAGGGIPNNAVRPFVVRLLADGEAGPGVLGTDGGGISTRETEGQAVVTVRRIGGSHGAVSVRYDTVDGPGSTGASAGSDYTPTSGRLDWADGDATDKSIAVPILANAAFEQGEYFTVRLSDPQGGAGMAARQMDVSILGDGDPAGGFEVVAGVSSVKENPSTVRFQVTRRNYSAGAVSVTVTLSGTATNGQDYTAASPVVLIWANGDASTKFVDVQVDEDQRHEADETVIATLSNPTGGAVLSDRTSATFTITDEDSKKGGGAFGALGAALLGLASLGRRIRRRS